jgi:S1-C subfamily serine protease
MFVSFFPISASAETNAGIGPSSFFYPLDLLGEKISLFFTKDPYEKAKKSLLNADERIAEIQTSKNNSKAIIKAGREYKNNITKSFASLENIKDLSQKAGFLTSFSNRNDNHRDTLFTAFKSLSEEENIEFTNTVVVYVDIVQQAYDEVQSLVALASEKPTTGKINNESETIGIRVESELDLLRREVEELKQLQKSEAVGINKQKDLVSVIKEWSDRVVRITCDFRYSDTGELYGRSSGSGTVYSGNYDTQDSIYPDYLRVFTNAHVVLDNNNYLASSCEITVLSSGDTYIFVDDGKYLPEIHVERKTEDGGDFALLSNGVPAEPFSKKVIPSIIGSINQCRGKPSIGDQVVILGYPSIGSTESITATEGIISSFEGDYIATSAKIERGNSGGAAILVKDNCYLGIPTLATVGEIESLAWIFDIQKRFGDVPLDQG